MTGGKKIGFFDQNASILTGQSFWDIRMITLRMEMVTGKSICYVVSVLLEVDRICC